MAPPWRGQSRAARAEHMRARLLPPYHQFDNRSASITARHGGVALSQGLRLARHLARHSAHRADDALDRYAVRHQPLLHGRGMPDPIPPRRLVDIGARISARKGYEKVGIVR